MQELQSTNDEQRILRPALCVCVQEKATGESRMRKRKTESTTENKITKKGREIRKQVKELAADLWQNEMIVKAGLAASGLQLAIAFSYASVWTWPGAVLKAAFIEACVWNINKAIQWGRLVRLNWRWQAFLWFVLIVVMYISIRANLYYEYEKKLAMQSPDGAPVLVNERTISRLDSGERLDAWQRGGLIPLLVLAMIAARRVLSSASNSFFTEETVKTTAAIRQKAYRERKKRELASMGGGSV